MNKSIKRLIPFAVCALSIAGLAGCGGNTPTSTSGSVEPTSATSIVPTTTGTTSSTSEEPLPPHSNVTKLVLNHDMISMFKGDEEQLEVAFLPRSKKAPELTFSSSNSDVATVDENGLVKAIASGTAVISVKDVNGDATQSVYVTVDEENLSKSGGSKVASAIKKYHKDNKVEVKKCFDHERFLNVRAINGEMIEQSYYDQKMIISKDDAYFYISSDDEDIKVSGGSTVYSSSAWYMYTNEDFDTYLFHINGVTKTYMVVDTTSYISSGGTRFDALCEVIDNLFVSGSAILTNTLDDVLGTSSSGLGSANIDYVSQKEKSGSRGDGNLTFNFKQGGVQTADIDDEDDYYIPAGTEYNINLKILYQWENYLCTNEVIDQEMIYVDNGDTISNDYYIEHKFETENIELVYPDRDEYKKVDDVFSL